MQESSCLRIYNAVSIDKQVFMKRFLALMAAFSLGLIAHGQSFELGFTAGSAVDLSCQIDAGADAAWIWEALPGLDLGFGTGLRYARPMSRKNLRIKGPEEKVERGWSNELSVPLFGRIRYRFPGTFFLMADAGYRLGGIHVNDGFLAGGYGNSAALHGFYVEPQCGFHLGSRYALGLGLTLHQATRGDSTLTISEDKITEEYHAIQTWSPIAFVRFSMFL